MYQTKLLISNFTMAIAKKTNSKKYKNATNNIKYGRPGCVEAVWNMATPIEGRDPDVWRRDVAGKIIKRNELTSKSKYAWNVDHKIPKTTGGSDEISNLQPLNRRDNIRFSNKQTDDKPGYNTIDHHKALLEQRGINIGKTKIPTIKVGDTVFARQTPVSYEALATIVNINEENRNVTVNWVDAKYQQKLPYDSKYFHLLRNRTKNK